MNGGFLVRVFLRVAERFDARFFRFRVHVSAPLTNSWCANAFIRRDERDLAHVSTPQYPRIVARFFPISTYSTPHKNDLYSGTRRVISPYIHGCNSMFT